jgi:transcriptional regulator with XRE-family HTH domain
VKNPAGVKAFSNRLRLLRKQKGYSQQKLADIADIEQSTVRRMELAQLNPTLDLLISVSKALEMEVRDLVDDPAITNPTAEV